MFRDDKDSDIRNYAVDNILSLEWLSVILKLVMSLVSWKTCEYWDEPRS